MGADPPLQRPGARRPLQIGILQIILRSALGVFPGASNGMFRVIQLLESVSRRVTWRIRIWGVRRLP